MNAEGIVSRIMRAATCPTSCHIVFFGRVGRVNLGGNRPIWRKSEAGRKCITFLERKSNQNLGLCRILATGRIGEEIRTPSGIPGQGGNRIVPEKNYNLPQFDALLASSATHSALVSLPYWVRIATCGLGVHYKRCNQYHWIIGNFC